MQVRRQMAKVETEIAERVRALHSGERELLVRHSLPAHRRRPRWS
jgi:hypothetical protein